MTREVGKLVEFQLETLACSMLASLLGQMLAEPAQ